MATNYPAQKDTSTTLPYPSATDDTNNPSLAGLQDNQNDAVIAIETYVGNNTASQTEPIANSVLLSLANGTSEWGTVTSSQVSGVTGTGNFVLANSPTLNSPTIDSPTINNPTLKTDTVSGYTTSNSGTIYGISVTSGEISGSNIAAASISGTNIAANTITDSNIASGTVSYSNLYPSLLGAQLQTFSNSGNAGGTFLYGNMLGIKILFGYTGNLGPLSTVPAYTNAVINLPSGFFTNLISVVAGVGSINNSQYLTASVWSYSTSQITVGLASATTVNGYGQVNVFAIGT